ncbi:DUF2064 domain-containing protein [Pontibacter sp. JH31]|uniref:DUF2064 domain-containing protein n=1 Tax=Pontibacter aquaedesilientis TaxID=2766980 RepID=A0ABR7XB65_9BACT|nr:DUF2064 domain-containing protein [Pontibacter aquaedesilientis]MBD1395558.1 DUF2064 domain-containing protein [Pontibacter aquaedesilientis]
MENLYTDTAILLFAHTVDQEVAHKTFSVQHGLGVNRKIAQTLQQHALKVSRESGIPVFPVLSDKQVGKTFGERLANAFQEVFAAGYQQVICIGSDCPALTATDLLRAQEELSSVNMVVGPASDGGAYLIGLHINSFDPEAFAMLNWQTDELLNELMLYSYRRQACLGCLSLLDEKSDVDNFQDLARQLVELPDGHAVKNSLALILSQAGLCDYRLYIPLSKPKQRFERSMLLRAPPVI